jgi:hypothetical protein
MSVTPSSQPSVPPAASNPTSRPWAKLLGACWGSRFGETHIAAQWSLDFTEVIISEATPTGLIRPRTFRAGGGPITERLEQGEFLAMALSRYLELEYGWQPPSLDD